MLIRFRRIMKWMALVSIVVAALAGVLVASGDEGVHIHNMIATAHGVGLSVLLAPALMSLAVPSSASGPHEKSMRWNPETSSSARTPRSSTP
jgi:hypothetical protein